MPLMIRKKQSLLHCYIYHKRSSTMLSPLSFLQKVNLQSKTSSNRTNHAASNPQKYHNQRNKNLQKLNRNQNQNQKKKTQERSTSTQTPASYTSSTTSATSSGSCSPAKAREQWPARTGPSKVNGEQATSRCPSSTSSLQPEGRTVSRRGAARRRRVRANRRGNSALRRAWNGSRHPRASSPRRRTRETRERGSKMAVAPWRHLASLYLVHHRRPDGTTRRPVRFPWVQAYQVSPPDTVVPQDHPATSTPQVFTCFCADINQPVSFRLLFRPPKSLSLFVISIFFTLPLHTLYLLSTHCF